jgi:hypothetical protein
MDNKKDGFKMFRVMPEGTASALTQAAKIQQEQDRQRFIQERGLSGLAQDVAQEITARLRSDSRFRLAWFGGEELRGKALGWVKHDLVKKSRPVFVKKVSARPVVKPVKQTKPVKVSSQGLPFVESLPKEWKSQEAI